MLPSSWQSPGCGAPTHASSSDTAYIPVAVPVTVVVVAKPRSCGPVIDAGRVPVAAMLAGTKQSVSGKALMHPAIET